MKNLILLGLFLSFVLVFSGCISIPEKKPENITTLRIGYQPTTHHVAEMVATSKGWWREDLLPWGVKDIREFGFPSGASEIKAMAEQDLDVAYLCTSPIIPPIADGLDIKIVAAVNDNGSNLVLGPGINYSGPESLRGLRIGTFPPGTGQDVILKKWLKENGVDISEVEIIPMGPGDAITAISKGSVDGVFLPQPAPAIIELAGKGRSVLASGEMWPNHACCGIAVSGRLIRDHPELVEQIVKTHVKATDFANAHPQEAARIYSNTTGQDRNMVEYSIKTWDGKWISDPHRLKGSTLEFARFQYQMNYTSEELKEGDIFDTSFYDRIS